MIKRASNTRYMYVHRKFGENRMKTSLPTERTPTVPFKPSYFNLECCDPKCNIMSPYDERTKQVW